MVFMDYKPGIRFVHLSMHIHPVIFDAPWIDSLFPVQGSRNTLVGRPGVVSVGKVESLFWQLLKSTWKFHE